MNIFGFLSTIIICATIVVIVWLILRKPFSVRIIRAYEQPKVVVEKKEAQIDKEPTPAVDKDVAISSMDAVVKAANELMGIETVTKEDEHERE